MLFSTPPSRTCARRFRGAFSLLELLVVLAIVGVLSGLVVGAGRYVSTASKVARTKAELAALSAALESYRRDHGDYPRTDDGAALVQALIGRRTPTGALIAPAGRVHFEVAKFALALPDASAGSADPFREVAAILVDPWERPYRYAYRNHTAWTNPAYVLSSDGPDGTANPLLLPGGFVDASDPANADNLNAHRE